MRRQSGFSLVELMVAMTITLIVSGAIYGLLTSGSNAFRREPEVADRQQNIRLAMDLISRDVFNAGAALPTFHQSFTRTDPAGGNCIGVQGVNGCGDPGSLGPAAAAARAPGDGGDPSPNSDVLEILSTTDPCPPTTVCSTAPLAGSPGLFVTRESIPACLALPGLAVLTDNESLTVQTVSAVGGPPTDCPTATITGQNGNVALGPVLAPWSWVGTVPTPAAGPPPATPVVFLYGAQIVRYRVAPSTDPLDTAPALWRSASGVYALDGSTPPPPEPGEPGFPGPNSPWQLVARGIEDLQVEYMAGDGVWRNQPALSVTNIWNSLVRQVRITLSARVTAANLQGETLPGGAGPTAVRGSLTTVVAPRAAFHELQMGSQIQ